MVMGAGVGGSGDDQRPGGARAVQGFFQGAAFGPPPDGADAEVDDLGVGVNAFVYGPGQFLQVDRGALTGLQGAAEHGPDQQRRGRGDGRGSAVAGRDQDACDGGAVFASQAGVGAVIA